jgi:hypothetical protein
MKKYYKFRVKQIGMCQFIIQKRWIWIWYSLDMEGNKVRKDEHARWFENLRDALEKIDYFNQNDYPFYHYQ